MSKYQFYISFKKQNNAGTKAIQDCNSIFHELGYKDFNVHDADEINKLYLLKILKSIFRLFFLAKGKSIIVIQYPLLSGNNVFRYFIKILRTKRIKLFCIVHDLESLRTGGADINLINREVENLNSYDAIIIHNDRMKAWLLEKGVKTFLVSLEVFDYLATEQKIKFVSLKPNIQTIVFAGNLSKSTFIYGLDSIKWNFNLYGPGFSNERLKKAPNLLWKGSFNPEEIVNEMEGAFGLIWDGEYVDKLDDTLGHYLKYNNPHKFSLYIAAGLPIIAPRQSAIADFILEHQIGILVNNLLDLNTININDQQYSIYKKNVLATGFKIRSGYFLKKSIREVESLLSTI